MSRICGVVDFAAETQPIAEVLHALAQPMLHHEKFVLEEHLAEPAALGRIHFGVSANFSSASRGKFEDAVCVCAGYITELPEWSRRVQSESAGKYTIDNPADLLAYLLTHDGPASLKQLNGIFAFALWQPGPKQLSLGADRYGLKPLYYLHRSGRVQFASELKSISYTNDNLSLSRDALEDLAVLSFISGDDTQNEENKRIPIGTVLTFSDDKSTSHRYWWFDRYRIDPKLSVEDYITESDRLLKRATARLVPLCDRPICTLTSGQDSRRVFLDLVECGGPAQVYSSAVQLKDYRWESDSVVAAALCREFGLPCTVIGLHEAKLEADLANWTQTLIDQSTTQHRWALPMVADIPLNSGVNFDGFGGDIFVYDTSITADTLGTKIDSLALAQHLIAFNSGLPERHYFRTPGSASMARRFQTFFDTIPKDDNRHSNWFIAQWARRRTGPFSQSLMSLKVETALPYFDNEVADFSMSLRPDLKIGRNLQHEILCAKYPDLMKRFPTTSCPGLLTNPGECLRPFVQPIPDNYFNDRMRSLLIDVSHQIAATPRMYSMLSSAALASALAVATAARIGVVSDKLLASSWRLIPLGLVSQITRHFNNSRRSWSDLQRARAFVYKR